MDTPEANARHKLRQHFRELCLLPDAKDRTQEVWCACALCEVGKLYGRILHGEVVDDELCVDNEFYDLLMLAAAYGMLAVGGYPDDAAGIWDGETGRSLDFHVRWAYCGAKRLTRRQVLAALREFSSKITTYASATDRVYVGQYSYALDVVGAFVVIYALISKTGIQLDRKDDDEPS